VRGDRRPGKKLFFLPQGQALLIFTGGEEAKEERLVGQVPIWLRCLMNLNYAGVIAITLGSFKRTGLGFGVCKWRHRDLRGQRSR
jgi:hypothetical protein